MKTIKIKVQLTPEQIQKYNVFLEELTWLWNKLLVNQLHNHCLTWDEWAEKKSDQISVALQDKLEKENSNLEKSAKKKRKKSKADKNILDGFAYFDLNDIIKCPLNFGNSAFLGATCRIATGGNYWKKDESIKIAYKNSKNEIAYKHGYKLVEGDKPYTRVKPETHSYRVAAQSRWH